MKSEIIVPKKCKVGFNIRKDTYTKKLGYVIYHDGKVWRKQASWESWREKYISTEEYQTAKQKAFDDYVDYHTKQYNIYANMKPGDHGYNYYEQYRNQTLKQYLTVRGYGNIDTYNFHYNKQVDDPTVEPIEFENVAVEGFVLNKKAGGTKYDWNTRDTYCRVYDPRGFEIEITIPNLLYILENTNSIKGKGLEGKFIYGWDKKDLVLVPESSPEFKEMVSYTELQNLKISKKELVVGHMYLCSDNIIKTYMGEHHVRSWRKNLDKKLWFHYNHQYNKDGSFDTFSLPTLKKDMGVNEDFANLYDKLRKETSFIEKLDLIPYEGENTLKLIHDNGIEIYAKVNGTCQRLQITSQYTSGYWNRSEPNYYAFLGNKQYISISELKKDYKLWQLKQTATTN